jgi:hypothetical protein
MNCRLGSAIHNVLVLDEPSMALQTVYVVRLAECHVCLQPFGLLFSGIILIG